MLLRALVLIIQIEPAMGYLFNGSNRCLFLRFRSGEGMFPETHASDDGDGHQKPGRVVEIDDP